MNADFGQMNKNDEKKGTITLRGKESIHKEKDEG
jgi:hypothetical protein